MVKDHGEQPSMTIAATGQAGGKDGSISPMYLSILVRHGVEDNTQITEDE